MLPIETVSLLLFAFWAVTVLTWLAIVPYWERKHMTEARERELLAEKAARRARSLGIRAWEITALGVILLLPLAFVVDGLFLHIGLLYAPLLSFFGPFDLAVQVAGVLLAVAGLAILLVVGRRLALEVYARATGERRLLTTGIYAYVRHPFYIHFVLLPLGLLLLTLNYLFLILFLFYVETDGPSSIVKEILQEERELLDRHGDEYREYMRRTGRLLPRLRRPR